MLGAERAGTARAPSVVADLWIDGTVGVSFDGRHGVLVERDSG